MAQLPFFLHSLGGKRIDRVSRVLYEHLGEIDAGDGPLEMEIEGHVVLFDGAADGERLRVRETGWEDPFPEPLSVENASYIEKHGRWVRVDCSRDPGFANFVGQRLVGICPLQNTHGRIAGVRLSVPTSSAWFVIEGDECHVYWAHPIGFTCDTRYIGG